MARTPKHESAYQRRGPTREPYDVVLIACEGAKTEPNYLNGLRRAFGLSSVNIRILQPPGQDPISIVDFVIAQLDRDREYNRAYCVFDRDGHAGYDEALRRVRDSRYGREGKLIAVTSVPCFEIWILLHYVYSTAAYMAAGGRSGCDRVIAEIRKHHPDYMKARATVFDELRRLMATAIANATRLEGHNTGTGSLNPSTQMHHLVRYLTGLKNG